MFFTLIILSFTCLIFFLDPLLIPNALIPFDNFFNNRISLVLSQYDIKDFGSASVSDLPIIDIILFGSSFLFLSGSLLFTIGMRDFPKVFFVLISLLLFDSSIYSPIVLFFLIIMINHVLTSDR